MTSKQLTDEVREKLQDVEIILSHLSNPNNLADSDGEHVRAILAETGVQKLHSAQDLIDQIDIS